MQALDQAQRGSGEGSEGFRGGLGGFGAQPGQVQQGSGEGSREGWEALAQSQVRFNRVPDQVQQEKVPGSLGANRVPEKVPGERLGGFGGEPGQVQTGEGLPSFARNRQVFAQAVADRVSCTKPVLNAKQNITPARDPKQCGG